MEVASAIHISLTKVFFIFFRFLPKKGGIVNFRGGPGEGVGRGETVGPWKVVGPGEAVGCCSCIVILVFMSDTYY